MALKGTPAQLSRMLETLASTRWTNDQLKQTFGDDSHAQAPALRPANPARPAACVRRGFHADAEGYKVDPVSHSRLDRR